MKDIKKSVEQHQNEISVVWLKKSRNISMLCVFFMDKIKKEKKEVVCVKKNISAFFIALSMLHNYIDRGREEEE